MICLLCKAEFIKKKMARNGQRYCSDKCRKRDFHLKTGPEKKAVLKAKRSAKLNRYGQEHSERRVWDES